MTKTQESLLKTIVSIASTHKTNKFIYRSHIIWDFPQHAIYINDKMLHPNAYDIPLAFSISDLDRLVELGYFEKVSEEIKDDITFENEIIFEVKLR